MQLACNDQDNFSKAFVWIKPSYRVSLQNSVLYLDECILKAEI